MGRGTPLTPIQKRDIINLHETGWALNKIAEKQGVSYQTVRNIIGRFGDAVEKHEQNIGMGLPDPKRYDNLDGEAKLCLEDFERWRRRYLGRFSTPWQAQFADKVTKWCTTDGETYVVVNVAPGAGKTTFLNDLGLWMTCRNRDLRGMWGCRNQIHASRSTNRMRRMLERTNPLQARQDLIQKGLAQDAVATLAHDYGRFAPMSGLDIWRSEAFTVAPYDNTSKLDEKEPTWAAFGQDQHVFGWRVDLEIWDDLVSPKMDRSEQAREDQQTFWTDEAETRLEPNGVLILCGQRLYPDDLYQYCLDMVAPSDIEYDEATDEAPRKYHHIVYPAHDEEHCKKLHNPNDPPWPQGCLLDPRRLPWKKLREIKANKQEKFEILYQQKNVDYNRSLVHPLWIEGGLDPVTKAVHPGCWDYDRGLWELPDNLGDLTICASADPSPTKNWSVQVWAWDAETEARYLLDHVRQPMNAPDFLDWNHNAGMFYGLMDEWQTISEDLGYPISTWIVEANACQKFLLQYDHVQRWQRKKGVDILPHYTARNKGDEDYGVQMLSPLYRYGRVRLPGKPGTDAKIKSQYLVDEILKWGSGGKDDCVMAEWFFEYNLSNIYVPKVPLMRLDVPSWLGRSA